jgi:hypothetical protein
MYFLLLLLVRSELMELQQVLQRLMEQMSLNQNYLSP